MGEAATGALPSDTFNLLSESDFSTARTLGPWQQTCVISDAWRADHKTSAKDADRTIGRSDSGALLIKWTASLRRGRLWQPLTLTNVPANDKDYDIYVKLTWTKDFNSSSVIDWIAILEESAEGEIRFLRKFAVSTMRASGRAFVMAEVRNASFDPSKSYRFCIQFKQDSCSASLLSASLVATVARSDRQLAVPQISPLPTIKGAPIVQSARLINNAEASEHRVVVSPTPTTPVSFISHTSPSITKRKKAVVIAWDMGHNPVGRAFLLAGLLKETYDVKLVGPIFDRYGSAVWEPIRDSDVDYLSFRASSLEDFCRGAVDFVAGIDADIIYVCKARMPSVLLGLLLKHRLGCPIVIDVDDHELSFFKTMTPISLVDAPDKLADGNDINLPFGETWTRVTESLIPLFDAQVVSNVALQDRFGGTVVRHARDEKVFGRDERVRRRVREEFGFSEGDRVILFLGTPRAHKGVFQIAEALERIGDKRLKLCVIGSPNDKRIESRLAAYKVADVRTFPDQPWEQLQRLINMADGVCLLQDASSPIAQYQIPAKLTDALATGVPVAVTDVAPFRDIPSPAVVTVIRCDDDLDQFLRAVASSKFDAEGYGKRARDYFIGELSYATNRARLIAVFDEASRAPGGWLPEWSTLLNLISTVSKVPLPYSEPIWTGKRVSTPAIHRARPFDIAFFWKQNDTGVYGRRHDMLIKHLSRHPRVGRIIQFDAPLEAKALNGAVRTDADAFLDQGNLVAQNTISRFLKLSDDDKVIRRVYVHRSRNLGETFLGQSLPPKSDYIDWVRKELSATGITGPVLGWVTPVVLDYPNIHDELGFSLSIADLIDDQRAMPSSVEHNQRLRTSYAETLRRVDLVISNCEAAKQAFSPFRTDTVVVPNAAEVQSGFSEHKTPTRINGLSGPVIGYVGNLRDRIDTALIARVSDERPDWHIVLIGSAHKNPDVLRLRGRGNVHFLGVKKYEDAARYISSFDVAIMPHLDNDVSRAMNPLKLYVYASLGVPIVTTNVANIGEISKFASIATSPNDFILKIENALLAGRQNVVGRHVKLPLNMTWADRVDRVIKLIDRAL